jgi:hypothetical protein
MNETKRRLHALSRLALIATGLVSLAGCNGPSDPAAAIRDFVLDFARSVLAAFLL